MDSGLIFGFVDLFFRYTGLFADIELVCGCIGLFCGYIGLFCGHRFGKFLGIGSIFGKGGIDACF